MASNYISNGSNQSESTKPVKKNNRYTHKFNNNKINQSFKKVKNSNVRLFELQQQEQYDSNFTKSKFNQMQGSRQDLLSSSYNTQGTGSNNNLRGMIFTGGNKQIDEFRTIINQDLAIKKHSQSYKDLSEKYGGHQNRRLIPVPSDKVNIGVYYNQLYKENDQDQEGQRPSKLKKKSQDPLSWKVDNLLSKFKKKELWIMAVQLEDKVKDLIENGADLQQELKMNQDRIQFLDMELQKTILSKEKTQSQLRNRSNQLQKNISNQNEFIERLTLQKEGLTKSCSQLSQAFKTIRNEQQKTVIQLKSTFEARFSDKLTKLYQNKEKQIDSIKKSYQTKIKELTQRYQASIKSFKEKYNEDLIGIQTQLNMKTSDKFQVEDRMSHLKLFVMDVIQRLKQKEVQCFDLESNNLKVTQSLNQITGERNSLHRKLAQVRQIYGTGLAKLKIEYKRQVNKGIETLTGRKQSKDQDQERSIHGRVNLTFNDEEDIVVQKINGLLKIVSKAAADDSFVK